MDGPFKNLLIIYLAKGMDEVSKTLITFSEKVINEFNRDKKMICAAVSSNLNLITKFLDINDFEKNNEDITKLINLIDVQKGYLEEILNMNK